MRLEFDSASETLYIGVREGEMQETLDLAEPGFAAYPGIDREGTS